MGTKLKNPETARPAVLAAELRVIVGHLKRRLRELTDSGELSWTQISILGRLENAGNATVTVLARAEGIRPQSMGPIVAALEKAGYIQGATDPNDGRQTIFSLTKTGRIWIRANRATRLDWLTRAIETRLNAAQQETLAEALELLKMLGEP